MHTSIMELGTRHAPGMLFIQAAYSQAIISHGVALTCKGKVHKCQPAVAAAPAIVHSKTPQTLRKDTQGASTTHLQSRLWYQLWWSSSMLMPRFSQQRSWKQPWHPSHTMNPGALFRRRWRDLLLLLLLERPQGHHQRLEDWWGRMSLRQKEQRALHNSSMPMA
jgi:hypothetical protein